MDRHHDAARLLLSARRDPTQKLHSLPEVMRPKTEEQAYLIQRAIMAELGGIGGWKVGSPGPTGANSPGAWRTPPAARPSPPG